jgi:isopropylmalate/homocitrate/citramalate synthase
LRSVEVGPRDGFQGIGPFIPTETKIRLLERLVAAGVRRVEIGSFVSATALGSLECLKNDRILLAKSGTGSESDPRAVSWPGEAGSPSSFCPD